MNFGGALNDGDARIRRILIVGGGTAGWMAAASLVKHAPKGVQVTLVESRDVAPVGVGEATVPPIMEYLRHLGLDEDDLVREAKATFKLGIAYRDWTRAGDDYFHPFGPIGAGLGAVPFPAYWLKMHLAGKAARLETYSIQSMAAALGRFSRPKHAPNTPLNKLTYALHFDAALFARVLRRFAEGLGVTRIEGTVKGVTLDAETGFIASVALDRGEVLEADLFIDCSGFRAVLTGALGARFEDWSSWLPCDRAVVAQTEEGGPRAPYTLVTARAAGWQWRIPLQHRIGNGYVYSSAFVSDDEAAASLRAWLPAAAEPALIRFTPGRRAAMWTKNCVTLGLASGFLEPLEATSIHMIQRGLAMLLKFFPDRRFERADIDRYNKTLDFEFARVRDFLLLHYTQTRRAEPFWAHCRDIALPDSLEERIGLFRSYGRILREDAELFPIQSWLSVMVGQGLRPRAYDPVTEGLDEAAIKRKLDDLASSVRACVEAMPAHDRFLAERCA